MSGLRQRRASAISSAVPGARQRDDQVAAQHVHVVAVDRIRGGVRLAARRRREDRDVDERMRIPVERHEARERIGLRRQDADRPAGPPRHAGERARDRQHHALPAARQQVETGLREPRRRAAPKTRATAPCPAPSRRSSCSSVASWLRVRSLDGARWPRSFGSTPLARESGTASRPCRARRGRRAARWPSGTSSARPARRPRPGRSRRPRGRYSTARSARWRVRPSDSLPTSASRSRRPSVDEHAHQRTGPQHRGRVRQPRIREDRHDRAELVQQERRLAPDAVGQLPERRRRSSSRRPSPPSTAPTSSAKPICFDRKVGSQIMIP